MDVEVILDEINLSAIVMSVINEISTGVNSIIDSMSGIGENAKGLDSIVDNMNNIVENTKGIGSIVDNMNNIVENTKGISSIVDYLNSTIENTRSENITGYMFPKIDEKSSGIYKTVDSINNINANAKGINNYHFIKIEEQLDQIINNTARNGYSTLSTIGDILNIYLGLRSFSVKKNDSGGGGGLFSWLFDSKNRDKILGTIGTISIGSRFFQGDESVGSQTTKDEQLVGSTILQGVTQGVHAGSAVIEFEESEKRVAVPFDSSEDAVVAFEPVKGEEVAGFSIMEKFEDIGSWFKENGLSPVEYYKNLKARQPKSPEGESSSIIRGPESITGNTLIDSIVDAVSPMYEHAKDSFSTIGQVGGDFFNGELGIGDTITRIACELLEIWTIINIIVSVIAAIAAVAVYAYFGIKDSSIVTNFAQSIQSFMQGMQNLIPSMQSYMPVFQTSNDTVPGIYNDDVANATQYTDSINKEPNIMYTVATNDVTGYTRVAGVNDFTNANNNVYAQHTLKNDNARNDYRELLALNSKSSDIYNTTINNRFDVHVTKEVNPEEVARYVMNEMTRGFKNAHKIRVNEII